MYAEVAQSVLTFSFFCKFGLRIFLEGWRSEEATAGIGFRCSLWCWAPGCPHLWLCPGTGYCSHAAGSISERDREQVLMWTWKTETKAPPTSYLWLWSSSVEKCFAIWNTDYLRHWRHVSMLKTATLGGGMGTTVDYARAAIRWPQFYVPILP